MAYDMAKEVGQYMAHLSGPILLSSIQPGYIAGKKGTQIYMMLELELEEVRSMEV